jgi:nucleoside phosphorylase
MAADWRDTLRTLLPQFEARAARSGGLNHLFVEVADHERDKMSGPSWFKPFSDNCQIVDGKLKYGKWSASAGRGLPLISPGFREAKPDDIFSENDSHRVVRDLSGVVRAVSVPMKLRDGYFCGQPSEEVSAFESLANAAAIALAGSKNLQQHFFASDLTDIFRKLRGGVRYVFGEVPTVPNQFIANGWAAGVLQFEHGVLIDVPIAESEPDSSNWMLLLHRLGWRQIEGSGLRAERWAWNGNLEVALEMLSQDWSHHPEVVAKRFANISKESYYSVLGTRNEPLDINLASAFAIRLLLTELSAEAPSGRTHAEPIIDYSNEEWHNRPLPSLRAVKREECEGVFQPRVGILVATETERQAVLKRMRPPKSKRAVLQVYVGGNTCFLGRLGVTDVVLCMTAMGSTGRDSSILVATEIIQSWKLPAVIAVGIAFGRDPVKQQIGNVLVSERIIPYEPQRVGQTSNENRGCEAPARTVLLNRFRNVVGWSFNAPDGRKCGIQVGAILSGEKLVDNPDFKKELFERYPTAIGGEMEGAGVAAAAERERCEWIVVKAICDWGDGTKTKHHQGFAAASSVDLVEHVLNQLGALDALA